VLCVPSKPYFLPVHLFDIRKADGARIVIFSPPQQRRRPHAALLTFICQHHIRLWAGINTKNKCHVVIIPNIPTPCCQHQICGQKAVSPEQTSASRASPFLCFCYKFNFGIKGQLNVCGENFLSNARVRAFIICGLLVPVMILHLPRSNSQQ
jgi:hypothetical protein